jgi:hypothetical protein
MLFYVIFIYLNAFLKSYHSREKKLGNRLSCIYVGVQTLRAVDTLNNNSLKIRCSNKHQTWVKGEGAMGTIAPGLEVSGGPKSQIKPFKNTEYI